MVNILGGGVRGFSPPNNLQRPPKMNCTSRILLIIKIIAPLHFQNTSANALNVIYCGLSRTTKTHMAYSTGILMAGAYR